MKNVHFIAIGGSVMHNLAIALHKKGLNVNGSDDQIFEPSRTRLKKYGLLPKTEGWNVSRIHKDLDAVILGMHAKADNPELLKAKEMGIKIFSFPEFLYNQTQNKKRIVIGGSHGKTTITSMVMHVLKNTGYQFDYMVGSQIEGFETMVHLSEDSELAVFEGDEYLSSPIDKRPKFHLYKAHIGLISGIAWDHINVFPTYEEYKEQFKTFIQTIEAGGTLIYNQKDPEVENLIPTRKDISFVPFDKHPSKTINGQTFLVNTDNDIPVKIFGDHNMANLGAAKKICAQIGIAEAEFYKATQTFKGAAKRLQMLAEKGNTRIFLDFAHAPSKLKATTEALKNQFPGNTLIACMELHSFSSLNKTFLKQYKNTMSSADIPYIFINPEAVRHKNLEMISEKEVQAAFNSNKIFVFFNRDQLVDSLKKEARNKNQTIVFMTSGNFDGINFQDLAKDLINNRP